jgi:hypothetical protein
MCKASSSSSSKSVKLWISQNLASSSIESVLGSSLLFIGFPVLSSFRVAVLATTDPAYKQNKHRYPATAKDSKPSICIVLGVCKLGLRQRRRRHPTPKQGGIKSPKAECRRSSYANRIENYQFHIKHRTDIAEFSVLESGFLFGAYPTAAFPFRHGARSGFLDTAW